MVDYRDRPDYTGANGHGRHRPPSPWGFLAIGWGIVFVLILLLWRWL